MPSSEEFFTLIGSTYMNKLFIAVYFLLPERKIDLFC